jgi:hypothetical protein
MADITGGPFWLGRHLTEKSKALWGKWLKANNLEMNLDDLHFTQYYAPNVKDDQPPPEPQMSFMEVKPYGVANLGDATVILFEAPLLAHNRFAQLSAMGYAPSFPTLLPHMTIIYEKSSVSRLEELMHALIDNPPPSTIFGPEIVNVISKPAQQADSTPAVSTAPATVNTDKSALADDRTVDIAGKREDSTRAKFLSAFGKALADVPELVTSWKTDPTKYRAAWVKLLKTMDSK